MAHNYERTKSTLRIRTLDKEKLFYFTTKLIDRFPPPLACCKLERDYCFVISQARDSCQQGASTRVRPYQLILKGFNIRPKMNFPPCDFLTKQKSTKRTNCLTTMNKISERKRNRIGSVSAKKKEYDAYE